MTRNNIKYIINGVRINIARAIERNDLVLANKLTDKLIEFKQAVNIA